MKRKRNDNDEEENDILISVKNNKILFYSDISYKSCFTLINAIDKANQYLSSLSNLDNENYIYLHICSDGGEVFPALSVIDVIEKSKHKIITVNEGCVASAAVLISMAGHQRYIRNNSYMLIHEIRSGCWGKFSECQDDMKNNKIIMKDLKKYLLKKSNNKLDKNRLDDLLAHDIIWNAKKSLKNGLVDKII